LKIHSPIQWQLEHDTLMLKATLLEHLPAAIFVLLFGFCIGSFLNVVIYRLPKGMPLLVPPSSCTSCNHRLRFFRENLPIIGWLAIRGKCRYCRAPVSKEYPIIEALTGLVFLTLYILCYWVSPKVAFIGEIFGPWWYGNGFLRTLPMFFGLLVLFSGLIAMTRIDARTFTIPIQIPIVITSVGILVSFIQFFIPLRITPDQLWPIPLPSWTWSGMALGGFAGILLSTALLKIGLFSYSFSDYEEYVDGDEIIAEYPHARREMGKELLFLIPVLLCMIFGWWIGYEKGQPPLLIQVIAGSMLGYIIGGGLVWSTRILGTLAFGREAMGLGDVHLLAAIGAVIGFFDPILVFFIAPFSGLLYVAISLILEKIGKKQREIPYGPHLAVATLIVILCRPGVNWAWSIAMPDVIMPSSKTLQTENIYDDLTNEAHSVSIRITPVAVRSGRVVQEVSTLL